MRWIASLMVLGVGCNGTPEVAPLPAEPAPAQAAPADAPAAPAEGAEPAPTATAPSAAPADGGPPTGQGGPVSGPVFHAVGQEPGWLLDVSTGKGMDSIVYKGDYGSVNLTFPAAARAQDPMHMSWNAKADGHTIVVKAERKPCEDAMSGKPYEATVHVEIDGRKLDGCGQAAH